jgi:hypothetical protein
MDVAVSALAISRMAITTYQNVHGFVKRAKVADQLVEELLRKGEQAGQLVLTIENLASSCGARHPSAANSDTDPWFNVGTALKFFQQYLGELND